MAAAEVYHANIWMISSKGAQYDLRLSPALVQFQQIVVVGHIAEHHYQAAPLLEQLGLREHLAYSRRVLLVAQWVAALSCTRTISADLANSLPSRKVFRL